MNRLFRTLACKTAFACGLLALPVTVHSQALPAAVGPGSNITLGGGLSWYQQDYGHRQIAGGFSTVDIHATWRYAIEGEMRVLKLNTDQQVTESTFLAGIKVNATRRPARLQPYAKLLVGAGHITLPYNYAHGTFFTYAPGAGADFAVNDRWSVRLVDVEVQRWTAFPFGQLQPYGISTGISFRLNGTPRFPGSHAGSVR